MLNINLAHNKFVVVLSHPKTLSSATFSVPIDGGFSTRQKVSMCFLKSCNHKAISCSGAQYLIQCFLLINVFCSLIFLTTI